MDGLVTADDCSVIMQKTLDNAYVMPCEAAYPEDYMLIADVNADGSISADDASFIMQYTLDNSFELPIYAVRGE